MKKCQFCHELLEAPEEHDVAVCQKCGGHLCSGDIGFCVTGGYIGPYPDFEFTEDDHLEPVYLCAECGQKATPLAVWP